MKSFGHGFLERLPISHGMLTLIRRLGEFKGKESLYKQRTPAVLETLRRVALIQSTESSNRIEGIIVPSERVRELVEKKTTPNNRSEQEIAGYRDALNTIHANYPQIPFTTGMVLQLHRDLYQFAPQQGGRWKATNNEIVETRPDGTREVRFTPLPAHRVPDAMKRLHERFDEYWDRAEIDPLLLIPTYVFDFLCIHPFIDGNGRMARLLSLLLLYRAGYEVGRYVSLEKIVESHDEGYYASLRRCSQGWHDGTHDLIPWWEYFLGVMLFSAYPELENRMTVLQSAKGAKTAMLVDVLNKMVGDFRIKDIKERCPHVGVDLIRRIMREERRAGRLECLGRGPDALWRRK